MSAFTESALIKKLMELNSSQQSIQTLSLWLIHHRKHHVGIIKTWHRELQKVPQSRKLTFMYLANDVIQNSKKKGPEYGEEFGRVLESVFLHIAESCDDIKLFGSLDRILKIWVDRGVYDAEAIEDFRRALFSGEIKEKTLKGDNEKRKQDDGNSQNKKPRMSSGTEKKDKTSKVNPGNTNGVGDGHVALSPHTGEPPDPEELIKALLALENSASSDAAVRERIANLPKEITEVSTLSKIEDKEAALRLAKQVNEAVQLLNDYNARLATEMEDRRKFANMLRDFQTEQKELLAQAEQRYEEYGRKLARVKEVQREIRDHISNLPDLTQLPDVTGGLAPLPSAGDLFNVH
uniref:Putative regulator of nuclear mrna n=1 Tax=Tabanus bromius TaxID=304241 RepID=A0A0K8TRL2_TABBR